MRHLDLKRLLELPVREGVHLVEASAGSGKTWNLSALFLRLVLEGLPVERILVVTFTNAATEELRGRVRERLRACLRRLEGGPAEDDDELVARLAARHGGDPQAPLRLRAALAGMDEAAIHTIHAFCRRVLQEHAFATRVELDAEILEDEAEPLRRVARDWWRARAAELPERLFAALAAGGGGWDGPDALLAALAPYLEREIEVRVPDPRGLDALLAELEGLAREAADLAAGEDLERLVETVAGRVVKQGPFRDEAWKERALWAAEGFLGGTAAWPPALAAGTVAAHLKKRPRAEMPDSRLLVLGDRILACQEALHGAFLREALEGLRARWAAWRRERGVLTQHDLLERVREALDGEGGAALARRLAERWPVAMVDEFQDTDPVQYAVFERLAHAGQAQVLIGDPKQAIYAFRGADIHAYLAARRAVPPERRLSLPWNWRSSPAAVAAVNAIFGAHDNPFALAERIGFEPASCPEGREVEPCVLPDGGPEAGLVLWRMPPREDGKRWESKAEAEARIAAGLAGHVAGLLAAAREGRARIGERALAPRDLAVLVPTHAHARLVREALARVGVASAYVGRDSVWATPEAEWLELVLAALLDPADGRAARRVLLHPVPALPLAEVAAWLDDPLRWERWLEALAEGREVWARAGFLPAFQRLLALLGLPARVLARPGGERALTNLLQLAELTQAAGRRHHGPDEVLAWFAGERAAPGPGDEALLRLESDESLVRVLTVHRAKGLEFPVVYLPFSWGASEPGPVYHDADGRLVYDCTPGAEGRAWREHLAEQVRLLYVALTRAVHRTYLVWDDIGKRSRSVTSALAWLLAGRDAGDPGAGPAAFEAAADADHLRALAETSGGAIAIGTLPEPARGAVRPAEAAGPVEAAETLAARRFAGAIPDRWRVSSYSQLVRGVHAPVDVDAEPAAEEEAPPAALAGVHALPRGRRLGSLMHALLERLDFRRADEADVRALLVRLTPRYGIGPEHHDEIAAWVGRILATPIADGLRLADLGAGERLAELAFHFRAAPHRLAELDAVLRAHGYGGIPEGRPFAEMEGLFTGQIDLVFRHRGRWYLADYKTTWLGPDERAYEPARLREAVRARHYDLQYLIYLVALGRYCRRRVPGWRYGEGMGGVRYLFLRGMDGSGRTGVHADLPPPELVEALERVLGGEAP